MDERELVTLMADSILAVAGSLPVGTAQIIVRPIPTWRDGQPAVWISVNVFN